MDVQIVMGVFTFYFVDLQSTIAKLPSYSYVPIVAYVGYYCHFEIHHYSKQGTIGTYEQDGVFVIVLCKSTK